MKLYVFPERATESSGYGIVVNSDYRRLKINSSLDTIIWYTKSKENACSNNSHLIINKPKLLHFKRFYNVLLNKPSSELWLSDLSNLKLKGFESIFCGDTILYRALRKKFPKEKIIVRFHNCYHRIRERVKSLDISIDLKYKKVLHSFSNLEKEIFADYNVTPIFLSKEDQQFYELITGREDSVLWEVEIHFTKANFIKKLPIKYLIYFGSIGTHKKESVDYLIRNIFPEIKVSFPKLEFHLYGTGTEIFNDRNIGVFGHGRYKGTDIPHSTDGLFLNPDITGGGVKVKVKTYLENNLRFISTPFGYEGYSLEYIDNVDRVVKPINDWSNAIMQMIHKSNTN